MNLKTNNTHLLLGCMTAIIILIGTFIEYAVHCGLYIFTVKNFGETSSILVQIQATMTTLIVAVIALLSGIVSKSYFGISVNSFYLEIKPKILRFKVVLIYEFILIALSLISHTFEYYNLVVTVFTTSMSIILLFTIQIFEVYKGEINAVADIRSYFEKTIESSKSYKNLGEKFINDWKTLAPNQSPEEFDEYCRLYIKLIYTIINNYNDINALNSLNLSISSYLLKYNDTSTKIRGIEFVINIYCILGELFVNTSNDDYHSDTPVTLIGCIWKEWRDSITSLNLKELEKLKLRSFLRSVLFVATYTNNQQEKEIIYDFGGSLGFLLNTQSKKCCSPNSYWWGEMINHHDFFVEEIPQDISEEYLKSMALLNFNISKGYLLNGQTAIVKHAIFQNILSTITYSGPTFSTTQFSALVLEVLLVHCFMYLVSFRIDPSHIKRNIQTKIKALVSDDCVIKNTELFCWELIQHPNCLTEKLRCILDSRINEYQSFREEQIDEEIEYIKQGVVKEYFLYVVLMINRFGALTNTNIINILNFTEYRAYESETMQRSLLSRFSELSKVLAPNYSDPVQMLQNFNQFIRKKIKDHRIEKASQNQSQFNKTDIQNKIKRLLLAKFSEYFTSFGIPYSIPSQNIHQYTNIHLAEISDYTELLNKEIRADYLDAPFKALMKFIFKIIKNHGIVEKDRLQDFKSDVDFMNFIEKNNYSILLGGTPVFTQKDYKTSKQYYDFLNNLNPIIIPYANEGVATNIGEIYIRLDDIKIDIQSYEIPQTNNSSKNNKPETITPQNEQDLNHDTNELYELLKNERKITNIYFSLTIGINTVNEQEPKTIALLKCG